MKILHSVTILLMASAFCASAQEAGSHGGFQFRKDTNPFLSYSNAASLSELGSGGFSTVMLSASKGNGGYVPLEGSDNDLDSRAVTESFRRISDRIVFHGLLSYSYFSGQNMGGPVLMDPSFNPVNFYESTDDTRGIKHRELYRLAGGMSYALSGRWSAGMEFDYESGDQAKIKDPRFSSVWMDMRVTPSVWFKASDKLSLGMSLRYRNTLENVVGGIYGTTDRQYFIFTDKGNYTGLVEQLDGDYNYMPSSTPRPMSNAFYGASVQLLKKGDVRFENELSVLYRTGYYGKISSSTATFFEFGGIEAAYDASVILTPSDNVHKFSLSADLKQMSTDENLFKYVTPQGQNTVVEYYAKNDLSSSMDASAGLAYDAWLGVGPVLPGLEYGVSVNARLHHMKMTVYPYSRLHDVMSVDSDAYVEKNFLKGAFCFSLGASALFRTGSGAVSEQTLGSSSTVKLQHYDGMLSELEYETASAAGAGLNVRFTWFKSNGNSFCVKISDRFTSLLSEPEALSGRTRNTAVLTLGYSF